MNIHHISLCTTQLKTIVDFYKKYFGAVEHSEYHNPKSGLSTCFLQFDKGAMLEVMSRPEFKAKPPEQDGGDTHIAMKVSDIAGVDFLTQRLAGDGYPVVSAPRLTGDHYYESIVRDPDGNCIEITAGKVNPEDVPGK